MLVGLVFGAGGDVALLGRSNKAFLAGLTLFLIGHLGYVAAFASLMPAGEWFAGAGPLVVAPYAAGGVLLANSNYTGASVIHTDQSTGIHAYELNLVETGRKFNFISGFRYTELNDVLTVIATEGAPVSQSQISTSNYLLGGQMGFRVRHDWELFGIEAGGKAGYMYNNAKSQTLVRDNNNTEVARYVQRSGNNDSFAGELSAKISYRPLPYLAITGGYQCYWITEVALSQDQLLDPVAQNANSGLFLNAHGDMFYHGPSVGLEARW